MWVSALKAINRLAHRAVTAVPGHDAAFLGLLGNTQMIYYYNIMYNAVAHLPTCCKRRLPGDDTEPPHPC